GFFRARRLHSLLSQAHARYKGVGIPLRASFGSASYDANSDETDLMRRADAEMYETKTRKSERFDIAAE
ncbi:MAG: hypothetical protein QF546_12740, partial [Alphaproteobacteria bacterium]|nr:hypothetical protein [Alphaproteobacteria bacterium]